MARSCDEAPNIGEAALAARRDREAREADALRENLRRRKAQNRARSAIPPPDVAGEEPLV